MDKSGNGFAVIRFLPVRRRRDSLDKDVLSFISGTRGWYIENSLTTINKNDPVSDTNRVLWNSGSDRQKRLPVDRNVNCHTTPTSMWYQIRKDQRMKGRFSFISLVRRSLIRSWKMQPEFSDETPINPFDMWKGADFKLKIRKVDGFWNYDKSEFAEQSEFLTNDEEREKVYNLEHKLKGFMRLLTSRLMMS